MVEVRESNHMHGWRKIFRKSRFPHVKYSQEDSRGTETHSGLKEDLLFVMTALHEHCSNPFLIAVMSVSKHHIRH